MSKKGDKSKGGNSFLTIKEGETEKSKKEGDLSLEEHDEKSGKKSKKIKKLVKSKSEEEKIEEFSKNVGDFLEKIEVLRLLLVTFFTERFPELVEKIKIEIVRGKLKALRPLLPILIVFQKINEKWFNKYREEEEDDDSEKDKDKESKQPKKPFTFLELAEKNIIFTDNKKRPLYSLEQMKDKSGYTASESVLAPIIIENIINAFNEVAPKAKSIPTPEIGKYAGIPMTDVMSNISEEDIIEFLEYVRNYPRGYVGKNYRITESFAGWAVSGTPED